MYIGIANLYRLRNNYNYYRLRNNYNYIDYVIIIINTSATTIYSTARVSLTSICRSS